MFKTGHAKAVGLIDEDQSCGGLQGLFAFPVSLTDFHIGGPLLRRTFPNALGLETTIVESGLVSNPDYVESLTHLPLKRSLRDIVDAGTSEPKFILYARRAIDDGRIVENGVDRLSMGLISGDVMASSIAWVRL